MIQRLAQDYAKAREWYEEAAYKGGAGGMYGLGLLYEGGNGGVAQDYAKAREWYEKAAAKDNADAKVALERLSIREALLPYCTAACWSSSETMRYAGV
jgi:uncharacterized protein